MRRQRDRQWTPSAAKRVSLASCAVKAPDAAMPIPDSSHLFHIFNFVHGNFKTRGPGHSMPQPQNERHHRTQTPTGSPPFKTRELSTALLQRQRHAIHHGVKQIDLVFEVPVDRPARRPRRRGNVTNEARDTPFQKNTRSAASINPLRVAAASSLDTCAPSPPSISLTATRKKVVTIQYIHSRLYV